MVSEDLALSNGTEIGVVIYLSWQPPPRWQGANLLVFVGVPGSTAFSMGLGTLRCLPWPPTSGSLALLDLFAASGLFHNY